MKKTLIILVLLLVGFSKLVFAESSAEINKAILKCADYEYEQDLKQNFFKYMILMVSENFSETEKVSNGQNNLLTPGW